MPVARDTDPDTSWGAARSVQKLTPKRAAVLRVVRQFEEAGCTDEMIAAQYTGPQQSPSGLRTRRSELVEMGLVEDTGYRTRMSTGRYAIVWRAT